MTTLGPRVVIGIWLKYAQFRMLQLESVVEIGLPKHVARRDMGDSARLKYEDIRHLEIMSRPFWDTEFNFEWPDIEEGAIYRTSEIMPRPAWDTEINLGKFGIKSQWDQVAAVKCRDILCTLPPGTV